MFVRLCVDLDRSGNVCGSSYELHGDDGVESFATCLFGPFDQPEETFADLLSAHRVNVGHQHSLF